MLNENVQQEDESNNNGLYQKKIVQDKSAILCPKMALSNNSGSALRILLKFCGMKGANRYMSFFFFLIKKFIWDNFIFFASRPFFTVWLGMVEIEPGHCYYWILKQSEHYYFHDYYWPLNSKYMIRIFKQSRHNFSGKHSFDGYCMDIMWCLCV